MNTNKLTFTLLSCHAFGAFFTTGINRFLRFPLRWHIHQHFATAADYLHFGGFTLSLHASEDIWSSSLWIKTLTWMRLTKIDKHKCFKLLKLRVTVKKRRCLLIHTHPHYHAQKDICVCQGLYASAHTNRNTKLLTVILLLSESDCHPVQNISCLSGI